MTRRDPDGLGPQLERLSVLAGTKGDKGERAVRLKELKGRVERIIDEYESRRGQEGGAQGGGLVEDFTGAITDLLPGTAYTWRRGGSRNIPPTGYGGAAALLKRSGDLGLWLAALLSGARGQTEPRVMMRGTSGQTGDWGTWREIYSEANILGGNGYDSAFTDLTLRAGGKPSGPFCVWREDGPGTFTFRFAFGLQVVWRANLTLTFESASSLAATFGFPQDFSAAAPVIVLPVLPRAGNGVFTGVGQGDLGSMRVNPNASDAVVSVVKANGAADFESGDSVSGVSALALGIWWTVP